MRREIVDGDAIHECGQKRSYCHDDRCLVGRFMAREMKTPARRNDRPRSHGVLLSHAGGDGRYASRAEMSTSRRSGQT
jgi:hypothetical protein